MPHIQIIAAEAGIVQWPTARHTNGYLLHNWPLVCLCFSLTTTPTAASNIPKFHYVTLSFSGKVKKDFVSRIITSPCIMSHRDIWWVEIVTPPCISFHRNGWCGSNIRKLSSCSWCSVKAHSGAHQRPCELILKR